jgi:hypothetical protein
MPTLRSVTSEWDRPRTFRREWIAAPDPSDERTIQNLCETLRTEPRIISAWIVGSRLWPVDGSPARESSDIALVLEPLGEQERDDLFMALMEKLHAKVQGGGSGRAWLLLSPEVIAAHHELATKIYSRPDPSS